MKAPFFSIHLNALHRVLVAWALALSAGLAMGVTGVGSEVEQQLKDLRADILERQATGQIAVVEIDAKSLKELDSWPWPRKYYAHLVDKLSQAGVTQIAFDVDFSSHSTAEDDKAFAESIARSDATIILPTFRQRGASNQKADFESLPIKILRQNAFLASVNVHPDKRGQLNQYSFGTETAGIARPSLASMVAEVSGNINENFDIDQSIKLETIPRLSFVDILAADQPIPELKNAKVIIGATAIELGDRYPVSRFGVIPGVFIQAMAAETLLQGTNLQSLSQYLPLAIAAIILLCFFANKGTDEKAITRITWTIGIILSGILIAAEYGSLFSYSIVPTYLFLGAFLFLKKLFATTLALNTSHFTNAISGLPNDNAMLQFMAEGDRCNIATAKLTSFHELLVVTDKQSRCELFKNIAERLKFLSLDERVFHVDTDIIAWVIKDDYIADIEVHFETAIVMLQSPVMVGQEKIKINATFGFSRETLDNSIIASEQAIEAGQKWLIHDVNVDRSIGDKLQLLADLDLAIENESLTVVYQPKWNMRSDILQGAEALVRWHHPDQGYISPAVFIPMLEKAGRIDVLTLFVLKQTLKDLSRWGHDQTQLSCSINISAQLLGDSKFVENTIKIVESSPVISSQVIFEVTETAALADLDLTIIALNRMREAGIKISIDDYGTGQSTMSYLQRLPVDEIKIDQSFVKTINTDKTNYVMVKSTIQMAHALGFKVVAEGIEDQQCMDTLTRLGCDVGQGWHISKPIKSEVFHAHWIGRAAKTKLKAG
ncbi:EAL domain-containing protein [Parasphingorhabdus sp. JC815]|uniref:EAL domain-containing protein n=1 Tax=Parasphingorhabdus sp. JC815 TaxID=3232140 RepID=UPI00345A2FB9